MYPSLIKDTWILLGGCISKQGAVKYSRSKVPLGHLTAPNHNFFLVARLTDFAGAVSSKIHSFQADTKCFRSTPWQALHACADLILL